MRKWTGVHEHELHGCVRAHAGVCMHLGGKERAHACAYAWTSTWEWRKPRLFLYTSVIDGFLPVPIILSDFPHQLSKEIHGLKVMPIEIVPIWNWCYISHLAINSSFSLSWNALCFVSPILTSDKDSEISRNQPNYDRLYVQTQLLLGCTYRPSCC